MKYFTFLLLFVCIAYTQASAIRSTQEIEEYAEFLRNSVHGKADEASSDPTDKNAQPAWELSGKFEGDIILTEDQIQALIDEFSGVKNAIRDHTMLWPEGTVAYEIREDEFSKEHVARILEGIALIEKNSCIIFNEKTDEDEHYMDIQASDGCSATVGYQGNGGQAVRYAPVAIDTGCMRLGSIVHELLHSLGFYHMHSTHNRDEYVEIITENINPNRTNNFRKYSASAVSNLDTQYDYGSIMHYSRTAFSIDLVSETIIPLKETDLTLGQREQMTETDIIKLNRLYKCEARKH